MLRSSRSGFDVGGRCLSCGWRRHPNDNSGKWCVMGTNKHPDSCGSYVQDILLVEHLRELLWKKEKY